MKLQRSFQIAMLALFLLISGQQCLAQQQQSILNQNGDELLKDFDVDKNSLGKYEPKPPSGKGATILKMLQSAIPQVNVDTSHGDPIINVKAPFVNVNVKNGQHDVKVNAPFVNVNSGESARSGVEVNAPFFKMNQQEPRQQSSNPFTNPFQQQTQNSQSQPVELPTSMPSQSPPSVQATGQHPQPQGQVSEFP